VWTVNRDLSPVLKLLLFLLKKRYFAQKEYVYGVSFHRSKVIQNFGFSLPKAFTVILFPGMQHGIKPFLEFSSNDRHTFRASAEYLRISFVQNELRLKLRRNRQNSRFYGFDIDSPELRSLQEDFQPNSWNVWIQDFSSEITWLLGGLAFGVGFEPKDPGINPQTAQKSDKKFQYPTR
jgi:hypothetical protein